MEKYLVKYIRNQNPDNETVSETLDLYIETLDIQREQKKISVPESELKSKGICEGDVIIFNSENELVRSGSLVNLIKLISENSHTDIEEIKSIYCADTDWFEVTVIINDEEKLVLKIEEYIAGVDLSGLDKVKNLQKLDCQFDWAVNAASISELTQLTELKILGANVSGLNFVKKLNRLKVLNLRRTQDNDDPFDISEIINLPELESLCLSCRKITDISYLSELKNLKELILGTCGIEDVSALVNLVNLERLNLFGNDKIKNFNVFEHLQNIQFLDVSFMGSKTDFSKIGQLGSLEELNISDNKSKIDLSFLQNLVHLKKLNMDYCKNITDISVFEHLTNLEELRMNNITKIKDYSPIGKLMHLKSIVMNKATNLEDISFLHNLKELEYAELFGNRKIKDFSPVEHVKEVKRG